MKKFLATLLAMISGGYLVALAWIPDPLPFLDEALALAIFVKSMASLGFDVGRWIPFLGRKTKKAVTPPGKVVDV